MACPFLTEGRAWYCHAAPMRKLILDGPGVSSEGRCTSPEYRQCELVARDSAQQQRCPHLEEVRVQYCGASPVTKLVPFSDTQRSSCTSSGYRYCDAYLARARPHGITPPSQLLYAANHFWLDVDTSGTCHIGIDDFLADVAGKVEGIVFATTQGTHRPGMALSVHGVQWPMCFPNLMLIQKVNNRVRSDPIRLTLDPYGAGWLFEGQDLTGITRAGLLSGQQAAAWQNGERERLARQIHEMQAPNCGDGLPSQGIVSSLSRSNIICLFQDFFGGSGWVKQ